MKQQKKAELLVAFRDVLDSEDREYILAITPRWASNCGRNIDKRV